MIHSERMPLERDKVVERSIESLGCPAVCDGYLEGRIDSLLTRGMLRKNEDGRLSVSPIAVEAL